MDIPYGLVRSESQEHYDYTQWIVVKDLVNGVLYYRTYHDLDILSVNLKAQLRKSNQMHKIPIKGAGH